MELVREFALSWYATLNSLFVALSSPLQGLDPQRVPSMTGALLLGLLAATSPCQISTNASSIAYVLRTSGGGRMSVLASTAAYVGGKGLMYAMFGLLAVAMGNALQAVAIPVVVAARKVLGPLMIAIGLAMLGVWRPRLGFGHGLSVRVGLHAEGRGAWGAFLLGVAFAFAFCPTLALLFFGYVIPMAIAGSAGPLYPATFAVGTTLPLLLPASALMAGAGTGAVSLRLNAWEPWLRKAAGLIFLLVGLNDTLLYWFI